MFLKISGEEIARLRPMSAGLHWALPLYDGGPTWETCQQAAPRLEYVLQRKKYHGIDDTVLKCLKVRIESEHVFCPVCMIFS